ncbi:MAG: methyl-accepting chemotaxis protein [Solirubrobacterales bacterium]|nr:methyl-accepting chemotaxis protein [Solirubrobacterales bacterium]
MTKRLPLGLKLAAGFAVLVALVAACSLLIQSNLSNVDRHATGVDTRSVPFDAHLTSAATAAKAAANDERGFLLTGEQEFADELAGRHETVLAELAAASRAAPTASARADIAKVVDGYRAWTTALGAEIQQHAGDPKGAVEAALGANRDLRKAYEASIETAQEHAAKQVDGAFTALDAQVAGARRLVWIVLGLLVAVSALLALFILRTVRASVRPVLAHLARVRDEEIEGLRRGLGSVAAGDLTTEVRATTPPLERQASDDLGAVAEAVEEIRQRSTESVQAYNETRASLADMIGRVSSAAGSVEHASREMANTSDETGRAVNEIAGAVGEMAQGAERQVRMIEDTRAEATATQAAVDSAREVARQGAGAAEQATAAMEGVRASSSEVNAAIRALAGKSGEISGIAQTITAIAEQTNLLALNAAIEAARAGDQGRGFAVVAEEVRKLAEESQQAAGSIAGIIAEIQAETARAVEVVDEGARRSGEGADVVGQAHAAFLAITDAVAGVERRIDAIVASTGEVAAVAQQSSASTEQVSASTEESSASAQQIASTAQELAASAHELTELVGHFTLTRG